MNHSTVDERRTPDSALRISSNRTSSKASPKVSPKPSPKASPKVSPRTSKLASPKVSSSSKAASLQKSENQTIRTSPKASSRSPDKPPISPKPTIRTSKISNQRKVVEAKSPLTNGLSSGDLIDIDNIDKIYEFDKSELDRLDLNASKVTHDDASSRNLMDSDVMNVTLDNSSAMNESNLMDSDALDAMLNETSDSHNHILYVLVVGFHHKKGCQIDFCYPPMKSSTLNCEDEKHENSPTNKLPSIWKTLPSIALPDGAHNYDRDTIYFHLPHPNNTHRTVYGISCYRQISAEKLKEKDEDVTRGTVQKSVVVLSELPLYGLIAVKCEMITTLYFKECDFSKTNCLKELYFNLNSILTKDLLTTSEVFLGLSAKDLILHFTHKIIILFKLILLEKKVLFHKSPVKDLCTSILTLLSLFPGMLEQGGLDYSTTNVQQKKDKDRKFSSDIELIEEELVITQCDDDDKSNSIMLVDESNRSNISIFYTNNKLAAGDVTPNKREVDEDEAIEAIENEEDREETNNGDRIESKEVDPFLKYKEEDSLNPRQFYLGDETYTPLLFKLSLKDCGFPLNIFRRGSYCHPYLSLAYLDILSDSRVKSIVIGATNYLFKQKRNLFDVIVELDGAKIDIVDPDLKKKLQLSTEDLRFADYLIRCIEENGGRSESTKLFDNTNYEGGDEWLRYQFKIYLIQLLITSKSSENSKEYHSFNSLFMNAWKETQNYRTWLNLNLNAFDNIAPGHPFYGQLSINDMKLKFNHAINNTERGKKINQTVVQTGKAVGSALTNARTAVYGWWSNLGKNVNNLDADKNLSITSSDTNLSKTSNELDTTNSTSKSTSITGLRVSNSFTSFTLSSLIKASEDGFSSAISSIANRNETKEDAEAKIETV